MVTHLHNHIQFSEDRWYKGKLYQSEHMLVGIDCLAPGQSQPPHMHRGHDKMYYVQSGYGTFVIDAQESACVPGMVVVAPADTVHSVINTGSEPLILLIAMAPEPK